MRAYEILLEYSREKTVQNLGNKLIDVMMRDPGMSDLLADKSPGEIEQIKQLLQTSSDIQQDLLAQFESADPTKNKQYTQWIIGRYIKRDFLIEDLEVVHRYLEKFIEAIRQKLVQNKDLNSYTLGSLKKLIREIYSGKTDSDDGNDSDDALYPIIPGTQVLYNGPLGQFVIPKTLAASQALQKVGHEAEWCTADSRAPTYYPEYTAQGPLYVWIAADGSKYQFHFPTDQFMDEWDNLLEEDKMIEFFKNNSITAPILWPQLEASVATKDSEEALRSVPEQLRTPELCRLAVKNDSMNLQYVPKQLLTPELCKIAVSNRGEALSDVPEQLRTPEMCKLAVSNVSNYGLALKFVPEQLRTPELCKIAVSNSDSLGSVPEQLRTPELCRLAVKNDGMNLQYVPEQLRTPELCRLAVSNHGHALAYVPKQLRTPELCKIAVSNVSKYGLALKFVPEQLRTPELCKIAVSKHGGEVLAYVPEQLLTPELCKIAVSNRSNALDYVPKQLRTPELYKIAVSHHGHALAYVPEQLRTPELCKIAVSNHGHALAYVPKQLQQQIKKELNIKD